MSGSAADLAAENARLRRYVEEAGCNAERAFALMAECDAERIVEVSRSRAEAEEARAMLAQVRSDRSASRIQSLERQLRAARQMARRLHARGEQQRVLMGELSHRLKNTLALVQGMVSQTLREAASTAEAREALTARVVALGQAHAMLIDESWSGANIRRVVQTALAPHVGADGAARFRIHGPSVRLGPHQSMALTLALHELGTNAVRHGALSGAVGRVEVTWRTSREDDGRWLHFCWCERDGPRVSPPAKRGFGSRLIERALVATLGGEISLGFEPDGVVCNMAALVQTAY